MTDTDTPSETVRLLTVNELIAALSALPDDERERPAWVQGCDCDAPAIGVKSYPGQVLVCRGEEQWDDETSSLVWRALS